MTAYAGGRSDFNAKYGDTVLEAKSFQMRRKSGAVIRDQFSAK